MHRPFSTFARALVLLAAVEACAGCRDSSSSSPDSAKNTAPVRIVLGWSGDTATSRAVTWRTAAAVADPQAQIGIAAPGCRDAIDPVRDVPAKPRAVRLDSGRSVIHYRAEFSGLMPATRYAYRVGAGASFSYWHCFTTASAGEAPFRFIYLGDAQSSLDKKWPPVARAAFTAAPDARFVAHAGDLLADGYDDRQWKAWLEGMGAKATEVPNLPAPGNHDVRRSPFTEARGVVFAVPDLWNAHFALPANGPVDLPELAGQNYYLDYQGARFVALDVDAFANDDFAESRRARVRAAQVRWLRQALTSGPRRWTIVVQHQPIYSVTKGRDFGEMRAVLGALYDEFHVDLVLQGHDHAYARTHKVRGGRLAAPDASGTVYVISVSGPKMYAITNRWKPLMAVMREGTQLYQVVAVDGDRLSCESRAVDGSLVDAFELVKAAGATFSYVDLAPGVANAALPDQPRPNGAAVR